MTSRRDHRGPDQAAPDRAVQGLLAYTENARRLARTNEFAASAVTCEPPSQPLHVLWAKATMAAGSDQGRPEQAACHGAKDSRSADA